MRLNSTKWEHFLYSVVLRLVLNLLTTFNRIKLLWYLILLSHLVSTVRTVTEKDSDYSNLCTGRDNYFIGAFAKFRKATISFFMSVRLFILPHATTRLPLDVFSWNLRVRIFLKSFEKIQVSLKSDKNKGYFTWRPVYILYHILLISSYNEKCFRQKVVEKNETHILFSVTFFPENRAVYEIRRKNIVEPGRPPMTVWVTGICMLDT